MARNAASWVWANSRAANGSLIVLLAIADELDAGGSCVMSHSELVRKTRLSNRAVRNGVADLTRLGELEVLSEGTGRGHRTAYTMTLKVADSATFRAGNPAESATFETETRQILPPLKTGKVADSATFSGHSPSSPQASVVKVAESATFETSDVFKRSTGSCKAEVKDVSAKPSAPPPRPDVDRLCAHLADRIEANGSKRPNITKKWRDACRLMIDKDGRTEKDVHGAIDWCQNHEFWRANILSMPKLREKYDGLRLQAERNRTRRKSTTGDRVRQAVEAGKRVQAMLDGEPS